MSFMAVSLAKRLWQSWVCLSRWALCKILRLAASME